MRTRWKAAAVLALAVAAMAASAQSGDDSDPICAKYAAVPLPAGAQVATPKSFPGCASYKWYRGIGRPVDYAKARACAWQERAAQQAKLGQNPKEGGSWVVGGSLILADLYANGDGVEKNLPLSMRFACEFEESSAELVVKAQRGEDGLTVNPGPFELCDYAATTLTMNFCGWYQQDIADDRRARFFRRMETPMTTEQRLAFEALLEAQATFIRQHAFEVDQEGTIRGTRTMGSQEILADRFQVDLVHFERGQWPKLSAAQQTDSEDTMKAAYTKARVRTQATPKDEVEQGAVSAEGLAKAQAAWAKYRAAWASFSRVRYPDHWRQVVAQIDLDRARLLKTID